MITHIVVFGSRPSVEILAYGSISRKTVLLFMKRMNLGQSNRVVKSQRDILNHLIQVDGALTRSLTLELCGSASVYLRGIDFRSTMDIDVCNHIDAEMLQLIASVCGDIELFDFAAAGVIGLFIDYEDRLIPLDFPFRHLSVKYLSALDWAVSKLASPELEDVFSVSDVTLDTLYWIRDHFSELYGGISSDRALVDLKWLISEKGGH